MRETADDGQQTADDRTTLKTLRARFPRSERVFATCDIIFIMQQNLGDHRSDAEIIRDAFNSLDLEKLRAEAHLSPTEKIQRMFDLIEQNRQDMFAKEKAQHPDESDELLWSRVRDRILEQQDLSDKVRADFKEWVHRKENESTSL